MGHAVVSAIAELQTGTEKTAFRAYQSGRIEVRRAAKLTTTFADAFGDEEIVKFVRQTARDISLDQGKHVQRVVESAITDAIKAGETDEQFLTRLDDVFDSAGISVKNPHRVRSSFETGMATLYNAGKQSELVELTDVFPYWVYITRDDAAVRPNHAAMHSFAAPASDRRWNRIFPPNGHGCRCTVDGLTAQEVKSVKGLKRVLPAMAQPDKGFAQSPVTYMRKR